MKTRPHRFDLPCNALPPPRWPRMRALRDVCQLNEYLLDVLCTLAASEAPTSPSVVANLAELWISLDAPSRRRAAQIPVLLLDLHFQDVAWWREVIAVGGGGPVYECSAGQRAAQWQPEFTREALMLAWPAVREDRVAAGLLFGMSRPVAALVGSLTPQQLDHVSVHYSHEIQLRWAHSHLFWQRLLMSAKADDMNGLAEVHLFGLQLLGGELMRAGEVSMHAAHSRHWH